MPKILSFLSLFSQNDKYHKIFIEYSVFRSKSRLSLNLGDFSRPTSPSKSGRNLSRQEAVNQIKMRSISIDDLLPYVSAIYIQRSNVTHVL